MRLPLTRQAIILTLKPAFQPCWYGACICSLSTAALSPTRSGYGWPDESPRPHLYISVCWARANDPTPEELDEWAAVQLPTRSRYMFSI